MCALCICIYMGSFIVLKFDNGKIPSVYMLVYKKNYLSVNRCGNEHCDRVWPWYSCVLIPPTIHHYSYIKTEHERQWNDVAMKTAIIHHSLKCPAKILNLFHTYLTF